MLKLKDGAQNSSAIRNTRSIVGAELDQEWLVRGITSKIRNGINSEREE